MNTKPRVIAGVFAVLLSLSYCGSSLAAVVEGQPPAIQVESEVVWYTTMALDDASVFVEKFKAKYPKVNVKLFRANNSKILERILAESRAKSTIVDVVSAGGLPIGVLKERGMLAKYISREAVAFPTGARDADGFWTDIYVNTFNLVYNPTWCRRRMCRRAIQHS